MQRPRLVVEIDRYGHLSTIYASTDIAANLEVHVLDYGHAANLSPGERECEHAIETSKVVRVYTPIK